MFENEFNLKNLAVGVAEAHAQNKKFYVVSNIYPHNSKIKTFLSDLEPILATQPDALIMADPGLIMMVKDKWPETEIHLSVQSNVVNFASVRFWERMGISRIILSRELSLTEIAEIRNECPTIELEVFVHGALCMAYSGRCMLSGYMNRRDANQGVCTNACRWQYQTTPAKEDLWGNSIQNNSYAQPQQALDITTKTLLIEEKQHSNNQMTMTEDEHGTYILNSKDLRAIHLVEQLYKMGIDCFKIEGRTKSHFYAAKTAQVYREAIDDAIAEKPFNKKLIDSLEGLANRGYTEGLLRRHVFDEYQNYEHGSSKCNKQKFVGEIKQFDKAKSMAEIGVKNRFSVGDIIEVMLPSGNKTLPIEHMENTQGHSIKVAPGSGHVVRIPLELGDENFEYGLLIRNIPHTPSQMN